MGSSVRSDVPPGFQRAELVRVGVLAAVATSPLVPFALFFKKPLKRNVQRHDVGRLRVPGHRGGTAAHRLVRPARWDREGPRRRTGGTRLAIGIAQMFAPLPGVSRSGLTIATALALGLSRTWAVGFSLLIAVPAILGAVVFEIKDVKPSMLTFDRVGPAVAGTLVAAIVGYFAIIWLTRVVRSGRLWWFAVYLIVLAIVVLSIGPLR